MMRPDASPIEGFVRQEAHRIHARYVGVTAMRSAVRESGDGYEAQLELRFPQHQLIVNAAAASGDAAVRAAAAEAERELLRLEARDPSVAAPLHAKAA